MKFLDYLIKREEIKEEQIESLQYFLDLELLDFLIKSHTLTKERVQYHWQRFLEKEFKEIEDESSI